MRSTAASGLRSVALLRTRTEASRRTHLAQMHRFLKVREGLIKGTCRTSFASKVILFYCKVVVRLVVD